MNNIHGFPVVDFSEKLETFIYDNAIDLPIVSIVGVLETVKYLILTDALD